MANVAPIAGAQAPTNFKELFLSMPDVYHGVYYDYLNECSDPNKQPQELTNLFISRFPSDRVPAVFVFQDNNRRIRTVHHIHYITTLIGQPLGIWDNICIGFSSDIHEGHISSLVLPMMELFEMAGPTNVPTCATMQAQLAAAPNGIIGPFAAGNDIEVVTSRKIVPVPYAYIHQFLFITLTPIEAWNQIGLKVIADGRGQDCAVLLNFLRMTAVDAQAQDFPDVAIVDDIHAPQGDAIFFAHLTRKLRALLPNGSMAPNTAAIAAHATNSFNQNLYVNKKHTVQGALNMSILATNIPALIRVYDQRNYSDAVIKFFTPTVSFLLMSIFIELFNMAITLWIGVYYDVTNPADQNSAQRLTNLSIICSALSTVVNIVIVGLGTNTSNTTIIAEDMIGNVTSI